MAETIAREAWILSRVRDGRPEHLGIFRSKEVAEENVAVLRGQGWQITVSASFDASSQVLTRRMTMRRNVGRRMRMSRETHRVHVYPVASIVAALERCGFGVKTARSFGRVPLLSGDVAVTARKAGRL